MSYLALYRKYRPKTFDDLLGQDHIVNTLKNQIMTDRIGHAYLFTGTRGTGKTSAAKIFAKAVNCKNPVNGSPCFNCESCVALNDPSNIDIIEIDAASNNGVNEIRELRENVQYPPVSCKYKVYIIDEVHMLTGSAFNALLKTLEEPPKHAIFILATTEVYKIPATILSRCMRFDFRLIPTEVIANAISKIYDEVGKQYDKEAVLALAKAGEGSMRDALSVADIALSYSDKKLTYDDVLAVLGASNNEDLIDFIKAILSHDVGNVLSFADKMFSLGKNVGVILKDLILLVRDLIVIKTCSDPNKVLGLPEYRFNLYSEVAELTSNEALINVLSNFTDLELNLKYSSNPRILFESTLIKSTKTETDLDLNSLLARVSELENSIKNGVKIAPIINEEKSIPTVEIKETNETETRDLTKIDIGQLNAILLRNLRNNGSEILFNVIQNVNLSTDVNTLKLIVKNDADFALLDTQSSKDRILEALSDFIPFNIIIEKSSANVERKEIDNATEKMKSIFGNDIIIEK